MAHFAIRINHPNQISELSDPRVPSLPRFREANPMPQDTEPESGVYLDTGLTDLQGPPQGRPVCTEITGNAM